MMYELMSKQLPPIFLALKLNPATAAYGLSLLVQTFSFDPFHFKSLPSFQPSTWMFICVVLLKVLSVREEILEMRAKHDRERLSSSPDGMAVDDEKHITDIYICKLCAPMISPALSLHRGKESWLLTTKTAWFPANDDAALVALLNKCGYSIEHILTLVSVVSSEVLA